MASNIIQQAKTLVGGVSMTVNDAPDNDIQYIFSTCTMEELKLSADITDQYVEDNTAIQDNMAIKPLLRRSPMLQSHRWCGSR